MVVILAEDTARMTTTREGKAEIADFWMSETLQKFYTKKKVETPWNVWLSCIKNCQTKFTACTTRSMTTIGENGHILAYERSGSLKITRKYTWTVRFIFFISIRPSTVSEENHNSSSFGHFLIHTVRHTNLPLTSFNLIVRPSPKKRDILWSIGKSHSRVAGPGSFGQRPFFVWGKIGFLY